MGLLSRFRAQAAVPAQERVRLAPVRRDAGDCADGQVDFGLGWPSPQLFSLFGAAGSNTGVPVTHITALAVSTFYSCARILGNDIGKLPLKLKRRVDGGLVVDTVHPLNRLLREPNGWQTPIEFWSYMASTLAIRGNAYAVIVRGLFGEPLRLIPVSPDRISVMLSPRGWLFYNVSHPAIGDGLMLHQADVLHIRGLSIDGGYLGVSPIAAAPDVFGLGIAAQQHAATVFRNGAALGGVLTAPNKLTPEAAARMGQNWKDTYAGVQNSHKVAVLEEGVKFEKIAMTSEDAQLLETRKYSAIEICRLVGVPPHKVYDLSDAHYANFENANQAYIDDSLQPICTQIEQRGERNLLFDDERELYCLEFDFRALLRGDRKSRYDAYSIGLQTGFLTINECRIDDGRNPIEGGDAFRVPLNTGTPGGNPNITAMPGGSADRPATEQSPPAAAPLDSDTNG